MQLQSRKPNLLPKKLFKNVFATKYGVVFASWLYTVWGHYLKIHAGLRNKIAPFVKELTCSLKTFLKSNVKWVDGGDSVYINMAAPI